MNGFTYFSKHAFDRIVERTNVPSEDVVFILNNNLAVDSGKFPGFNRKHWVFYSEADDDYFVAIQDQITGTLVTILTLEYHANLAWEISVEECQEAKRLWLNKPPPPAPGSYGLDPEVFLIKFTFLNENGLRKTKTFLKIKSKPYANDIKKFLSDKSFFPIVEKARCENNINKEDMLLISVVWGNHGDPVFVDVLDFYKIR